jgi:hypothetical protein
MLMAKLIHFIFIYKSMLCVAFWPVPIFAVESVPVALFRSLLWGMGQTVKSVTTKEII